MLRSIAFPPLDDLPAIIRVTAVHVARGDRLSADAAVADFRVLFAPGASYQCPPAAHFRLSTRDPGRLVSLDLAVGDVVSPGARLAVLSSSSDVAPGDAPTKDARVTLAGILPPQEDWWMSSA